jgi:hypothetical protein
MVEGAGKVRVVWRIMIWEIEKEYVRRHKVSNISLDAISNGKLGGR